MFLKSIHPGYAGRNGICSSRLIVPEKTKN
nr:MAG TPA: hypothetical protein [Caudoviricetes sp.]